MIALLIISLVLCVVLATSTIILWVERGRYSQTVSQYVAAVHQEHDLHQATISVYQAENKFLADMVKYYKTQLEED